MHETAEVELASCTCSIATTSGMPNKLDQSMLFLCAHSLLTTVEAQ